MIELPNSNDNSVRESDGEYSVHNHMQELSMQNHKNSNFMNLLLLLSAMKFSCSIIIYMNSLECRRKLGKLKGKLSIQESSSSLKYQLNHRIRPKRSSHHIHFTFLLHSAFPPLLTFPTFSKLRKDESQLSTVENERVCEMRRSEKLNSIQTISFYILEITIYKHFQIKD